MPKTFFHQHLFSSPFRERHLVFEGEAESWGEGAVMFSVDPKNESRPSAEGAESSEAHSPSSNEATPAVDPSEEKEAVIDKTIEGSKEGLGGLSASVEHSKQAVVEHISSLFRNFVLILKKHPAELKSLSDFCLSVEANYKSGDYVTLGPQLQNRFMDLGFVIPFSDSLKIGGSILSQEHSLCPNPIFIEGVQSALGVEVDGKCGKKTAIALREMLEKTQINPSKITKASSNLNEKKPSDGGIEALQASVEKFRPEFEGADRIFKEAQTAYDQAWVENSKASAFKKPMTTVAMQKAELFLKEAEDKRRQANEKYQASAQRLQNKQNEKRPTSA